MESKEKEILVSISCITYNHAPYIRQCLDGFLMQQTNFAFEVLIHDDCSTDGTTEIIKEYELKYPDIIKPIYEEKNQYQQGKPSGSAIWNFPRAKGKYIAMCEGDDYWIDPLKLQKQVDILESDSNCSLVVSDGEYLFEKEGIVKPINPLGHRDSGIIPIDELFEEVGGLIPTASMVFRSSFSVMPEFFYKAPVGDKPIRMWLALNGTVFYMNEKTLVYRVGSVSSFGRMVATNHSYASSIYRKMVDYFISFNAYTENKYTEVINRMIEKEEYMYYQRVRDVNRLMKTNYFLQLPIKVRVLFRIKNIIKRILRLK